MFKIGDVVERKDENIEEHKYMVPAIIISVVPDTDEVIAMVDDSLRYVALCEDLKLSGIPNVFDWVSEELQA